MTLNTMGKKNAITELAMIVASYIADSVDAASKLNPGMQILHIIQFAWQRSAVEDLKSDRAIAAMEHAFIILAKSILGS